MRIPLTDLLGKWGFDVHSSEMFPAVTASSIFQRRVTGSGLVPIRIVVLVLHLHWEREHTDQLLAIGLDGVEVDNSPATSGLLHLDLGTGFENAVDS